MEEEATQELQQAEMLAQHVKKQMGDLTSAQQT
jgi:hypothetical protein